MGYTRTDLHAFPYAAAAVLASRRYARPAARWRRPVAPRLKLRSAASRTRTVTRRRSRKRRLRTSLRARRRAQWNMNGPGRQVLRFKNVNEISFGWKLSFAQPATQPVQISAANDEWMSQPGTNDRQEAIWNTYNFKKLRSLRWRLTNIRIFMEVTTTLPAVGTAPPVTDIQVTEVPEWVFWYWRMLSSGNTFPPASNHESRYSRMCKKNCNSSISGFVPINYKKMNWITSTYSAFATGQPYASLKQYFSDVGNGWMSALAEDANHVWSPNIYIMADDPFPANFYPNPTAGVTRTVQLTVLADMITYATWSLRAQLGY